MSATSLEIRKLDLDNPAIRQRLWDYLAPHETRVMFILGNLRANTALTHMYVPEVAGKWWVGVAAYYERHKSFVPFSLDAEVVQRLTRHVAAVHPQVEWLNGWQDVAAPAMEELARLGYQGIRDPRQVFMELEGRPPEQPYEHCCRLHTPEDAPAVARLLRCLRGGGDPDAPITDEELARARATPLRWVLEHEGKIVATAACSGLAIRACQIIGVATDPAQRGKGFARSVCAKLIRDMAAQGAQRTVLFTGEDNVSAHRCYQGLGFTITSRYICADFKPPTSGQAQEKTNATE